MYLSLREICVSLLILINWFGVESCGKPYHLNALIFNGRNVSRGEHPWKAALYKYDERSRLRSYKCGGVLISERHVVTGEWLLSKTLRIQIN